MTPISICTVGPWRRSAFLLVFVASFASKGFAGDSSEKQPATDGSSVQEYVDPPSYRSRNFLIHTDLPEAKAKSLLKRLESTLEIVSRYWRRKPRGTIECYVVDDFRNWQDSSFPHPFARSLITGVGGGTFATFERENKQTKRKAIVYSTARPGVAEHESVHAYCCQTFLDLGPVWYKEGMAQMAYYQSLGQTHRGVCCEKHVARFLRTSPLKSICSIVEYDQTSRSIEDSLIEVVYKNSGAEKRVTEKERTESSGNSVRLAKEKYRWYWALCHLLSQNPNYADRFRILGSCYLNRKQPAFAQLFGPMHDEINFEYRFFLKRIDIGYRVDLCRWDWKKKFGPLESGEMLSVSVEAARGYQASGLLVGREKKYSYGTEGVWKTAVKRTATNADGDRLKRGRLTGVVMSEGTLGKPFDLGVSGTFTSPEKGKLYLRCRDAWNNLADNSGHVMVRIAAD